MVNARWGLEGAFIADAATFLVGALVALRLRIPKMLRELIPNLKVRFINIVDLMTLQPPAEHPHGLSNRNFDTLFTAADVPSVRTPRTSMSSYFPSSSDVAAATSARRSNGRRGSTCSSTGSTGR